MKCTCPKADPNANPREGDKDCPEHGFEAIARELDGMSLYKFDDGFQCFARTQASADRCRLRVQGAKA